jgi:hypothetical protein
MPERTPHGAREKIQQEANISSRKFEDAWRQLQGNENLVFEVQVINATGASQIRESLGGIKVIVDGDNEYGQVFMRDRMKAIQPEHFVYQLRRHVAREFHIRGSDLNNVFLTFKQLSPDESRAFLRAVNPEGVQIEELKSTVAHARSVAEQEAWGHKVADQQAADEIASLEADLAEARAQRDALEKVREALSEENDTLRQREHASTIKIADLEAENKKLKDAIDAISVAGAGGPTVPEVGERIDSLGVRRVFNISPAYLEFLKKYDVKGQYIQPNLPDKLITGLAGVRSNLDTLFEVMKNPDSLNTMKGIAMKLYSSPLRGLPTSPSVEEATAEARAMVPTLEMTLDLSVRGKAINGELYAVLEAAQLVGHAYALTDKSRETAFWRALNFLGVKRVKLIITNVPKGKKKAGGELVRIDIPTIPHDEIVATLRQKGMLPRTEDK